MRFRYPDKPGRKTKLNEVREKFYADSTKYEAKSAVLIEKTNPRFPINLPPDHSQAELQKIYWRGRRREVSNRAALR